MEEFYSQDEVQQILHLAIARQSMAGELTRAQLLEIADEMGISRTDLQIAEQQWMRQRGEAVEREAFNQLRRDRLRQKVVRFVIINGFLLVLDGLTAGALTWSRFVLLGWGALLAVHAWKTLQFQGDAYDDAFQRWRQKRWLKQSVNSALNRWLKPLVQD